MSINNHSGAKRDTGHVAWFVLGLTAAGLIGAIMLSVMSLAGDGEVSIAVLDLSPPKPILALARAERDHSPDTEKTLARPLFSSNRRPPTDIAASTASPSRPMPRLTGVVVSPVGKFALFANTDGGRPLVMGEGDHLGATVIEAIMAGEVTVRGPNGVVVLHSSFDESVAQASLRSPPTPPKQGPLRLPFAVHASPQPVRANQGLMRPASLGGATTP